MNIDIATPTAPSIDPVDRSLPATATAFSGDLLSTAGDVWEYRDASRSVRLDFTAVPVGDALRHAVQHTLLWYIENRSASHVRNLYEHFLSFALYLHGVLGQPVTSIRAVDVTNYKASLDQSRLWHLTVVSGLLRKLAALGYTGVEPDAVMLLEELRLPGNEKGVAVLTMDPERGPYSDIEYASLQRAVDEAFEKGDMSEDVYILAWLFMALGSRPVQLCALKLKDLLVVEADGVRHYVLRVPRAKQTGANARAQFKNRQLIPQIGAALERYLTSVRDRFQEIFEDVGEAPVFPMLTAEARAPGFEYHHLPNNLSQKLTYAITQLKVRSERTGEYMNGSPIRCRRTLGTRAAQEGLPELVIAELLDHTDTQNVHVYVAATPEIAIRIDKALALQVGPLAQAFAGLLIPNETSATRAGDRASRIADPRIDSARPVGSCGQHAFCGFHSPIACYTCKSFEPWLDGPHEAVLDFLLAERDRQLESISERVATVNDRTILAVAQVVELCRATKAARSEV